MDAFQPARPKLTLRSSHRSLRLAISHSTPGQAPPPPGKKPTPPRTPIRK